MSPGFGRVESECGRAIVRVSPPNMPANSQPSVSAPGLSTDRENEASSRVGPTRTTCRTENLYARVESWSGERDRPTYPVPVAWVNALKRPGQVNVTTSSKPWLTQISCFESAERHIPTRLSAGGAGGAARARDARTSAHGSSQETRRSGVGGMTCSSPGGSSPLGDAEILQTASLRSLPAELLLQGPQERALGVLEHLHPVARKLQVDLVALAEIVRLLAVENEQ